MRSFKVPVSVQVACEPQLPDATTSPVSPSSAASFPSELSTVGSTTAAISVSTSVAALPASSPIASSSERPSSAISFSSNS